MKILKGHSWKNTLVFEIGCEMESCFHAQCGQHQRHGVDSSCLCQGVGCLLRENCPDPRHGIHSQLGDIDFPISIL